jgi:hypothetical protein
MWPPLLKLFEALGRFRLPLGPTKVSVQVGAPGAVDVLGGFDWQDYRAAEALFTVWGPARESIWEPYHCVPLFAALDTIKAGEAWPTPANEAASFETPPHLGGDRALEPLGQAWAEAGVWMIVDLPGAVSVPLATRFILAGYQPVCTFDHWPHPAGLLKPEYVLAQLLRFAPVVAQARETLRPENPPLWICDRDRLGHRPGRPQEFDNRYFLDDSLLPGPETLRRAGVQHIVCLVPDKHDSPIEDLHAYFRDLRQQGFHDIHTAALNDPEWQLFELAAAPSSLRFAASGFQRSAAGGFGRLIPEPSSSGG